MDIGDLMAAVNQLPDDEVIDFTPIQHIARLRDVLDKIDADPDRKFERGDILVHRFADMANSKMSANPAMFSRWLDDPFFGHERGAISTVEDLTGTVAAVRFDCAIYVILSGRLLEFLVDSREYDHYPNPDGA